MARQQHRAWSAGRPRCSQDPSDDGSDARVGRCEDVEVAPGQGAVRPVDWRGRARLLSEAGRFRAVVIAARERCEWELEGSSECVQGARGDKGRSECCCRQPHPSAPLCDERGCCLRRVVRAPRRGRRGAEGFCLPAERVGEGFRARRVKLFSRPRMQSPGLRRCRDCGSFGTTSQRPALFAVLSLSLLHLTPPPK